MNHRDADEAAGIYEGAALKRQRVANRDAGIARVLKDPENARDLSNEALATRFGCSKDTIASARKRIGAAEYVRPTKGRNRG